MVKICPVCSKTFTTKQNAQKFCSVTCKEISSRKDKVMVCEYCLKEVQGRKRKYCSNECRLMAYGRMPDKEGIGGYNAPKLPEITLSDLSLPDVTKAARAEGLSYGQYVQKYNLN